VSVAGVIHDLAVEHVPVALLRTYHRNPRRGDVEAIRRSLRVNGQYRPVVVNRGTHTGRPDEVLAGNHTLMAAREEGWATVAACFVDVDDDQAARIVAADNRTADLGAYDEAVLAELLRELPDLEGTGYTEEDLAALVAGGTPLEGDPDDAPPLAAPDAPTRTAPGEVWHLGPHRLLVGDSTDLEAAKGLLGGQRADVMWTDPPYGVDYVGKTKDALTIKNDGELDLPALLTGFLAVAGEVLRPGAAAYMAHPAGALSIGQHIEAAGWSLRQQLIWVKDALVIGHSDYHYRHEPIWMAYTPGGKGRLGRGGPAWHGDDSAQSVFEVARPKRSEEHPTMKPVELIQPMLVNSCPRGGIVYDPFAGSGSTLIAAHALGMAARLVELDPRYADVICRRYQRATGDLPVNAATGEAADFDTDDDREG
jgi:DNA modification methylase